MRTSAPLVVIGNVGSGLAHFQQFLSGVSHSLLVFDPRHDPDIQEIISQVPEGARVLHLQRSYEAVLGYLAKQQLGAASVNDQVAEVLQGELKAKERLWGRWLLQLYKADLAIRKLKESHGAFLDLYLEHLPERGGELAAFTNCGNLARWTNPEPILEEELLFSEDLSAKIQLYEDRRFLLTAARFLSEDCRTHLNPSHPSSSNWMEYSHSLLAEKRQSLVAVDVRFPLAVLREFLQKPQPGRLARNLVFVFEDMDQVREIFHDGQLWQALEEYRLKLWHISEWRPRLLEEYRRYRSSLISCTKVVAPQESENKQVMEVALESLYSQLMEVIKGAHFHAQDYYQSSEFAQRLQRIAEGESPRVLIEQSCPSIATKRFSRNLAATLKDQGYEVYIHEPCRLDRVDFAPASLLEISEFKPDLLVHPPNIFGYSPYRNLWGLPKVYSFQDLGPHVEFVKYVRKEGLCRHDVSIVLEKRFVSELVEAGLPKDQVLFELLPAEAPHFDLDAFVPESLSDVGFVKTMHSEVGLLSRIYPKAQSSYITLAERGAITRAEREVIRCLKEEGGFPYEACKELAGPYHWKGDLEAFTHEQLCVRMINAIHQKGLDLSLGGHHWDKFPHLSRYCRGHIESREAYQKSFLESKINLSINPWDEVHPRIFDGGRCGAFFLVYKIPEAVLWQRLPEYLQAGVHFDYFESPEDLVEKIQYYLDQPEKRKEIGHNLQQVIKERHSYDRVATDIIERFRHLLQSRGSQPESPKPKVKV